MAAKINYRELPFETDQELLKCLHENDARQFTRLYDRFSAALFSLIIKWIKDTEVAENLLQDVFLKAWRCREHYDASRGRIFTWLYNIARNLCIDHFRSKTFKKSKASFLCDNMAEWHGEKNAGSFLPDTIGLRAMIGNLRKEEKEIIELVYFKGFTQREIADTMNIPLGTVKTRMSRAIRDLRYFFKKDWKEAMQAISLN